MNPRRNLQTRKNRRKRNERWLKDYRNKKSTFIYIKPPKGLSYRETVEAATGTIMETTRWNLKGRSLAFNGKRFVVLDAE